MKKTSILIVVLIGIALVLGVLIYQGTSVSTPEAPPGTGKTSTAPSRGLADISAKIPKSISDPKEREALTPLSD
ncbi:MAG: hypothetical protein HY001_02620, partial [Candidatus Portnoybacteria bacterium]|nr:hypothetical protein [Candidatus Portnoybacteria bacterium]